MNIKLKNQLAGIAFSLLTLTSAASAQNKVVMNEGGHSGNGGSGLIGQFEFNVDQIQGWIYRNRLAQLDLTDVNFEVPLNQFVDKVLESTSNVLAHKTSIVFTTDKIEFEGQERTCRNLRTENLIKCNIPMWNLETPESRYLLVLHEMISIAGFEKNDGPASEYRFSRKLLPYIAPMKVYVLADQATQKRISSAHCRIYYDNSFRFLKLERMLSSLGCVKVNEKESATYIIEFGGYDQMCYAPHATEWQMLKSTFQDGDYNAFVVVSRPNGETLLKRKKVWIALLNYNDTHLQSKRTRFYEKQMKSVIDLIETLEATEQK